MIDHSDSPPVVLRWARRWWPLGVAIVITAVGGYPVFVTSPGWLVATLALPLFVMAWWAVEFVAIDYPRDTQAPVVVYPLHAAAAAPRAWLLLTPAWPWVAAWLVALTVGAALTPWPTPWGVVVNLIAVAALLVLLVSSAVLVALTATRRPGLGVLSLLGFVVLLAVAYNVLSRFARLDNVAQTWLAYGAVIAVVAVALWWCHSHPRSVDPREDAAGGAA